MERLGQVRDHASTQHSNLQKARDKGGNAMSIWQRPVDLPSFYSVAPWPCRPYRTKATPFASPDVWSGEGVDIKNGVL
jgi:hypothetical protein